MSKESRRKEKAKAMTEEMFKKPDDRPMAERIAEMRKKTEAAKMIGMKDRK